MSKQWYYSAGDSQLGPIPESDLNQLISNQAVQKETLVWSDGMGDWAAAGDVLSHLFVTVQAPVAFAANSEPKPTPVTTESVSDMFAPTASVLGDTSSNAGSNLSTTDSKNDVQLDVGEAYKASTTSQLMLSDDVYTMTVSQILFSFEGRIRRSTYWGYTLATFGVFLALYYILFSVFAEDSSIAIFVILALLVPFFWTNLAISVKRWHDRGKSGWWVLIRFVPYIGEIWALVENGCLDGDHGPNMYGTDPKSRSSQSSRFK